VTRPLRHEVPPERRSSTSPVQGRLSEGQEHAFIELYQRIMGFASTQAIYVAVKLKIPDLLESEPQTYGDLARKSRCKPPLLHRFLGTLAAMGVVRHSAGDRFALTAAGRLLCRNARPGLRDWALWWGGLQYMAASKLEDTLRTGRTAFDTVYGRSVYDYLQTHPKDRRIFNDAMNSLGLSFEALVSRHNFGQYARIVDIGGGEGEFLRRVLARHPVLKGTLLELPPQIHAARRLLAARELKSRITLRTGSMFRRIPSGGDAYFMSTVLHSFPDSMAARVLRNCRKAMEKGSDLLIFEQVIPGTGRRPSSGSLADLTMMFGSGGVERTRQEWNSLLRSTGFRVSNVIPVVFQRSLLVAKAV
jgi:hypothetical protein